MKFLLMAEIAEQTKWSDDLKGAIITAVVTGIVSIIGFIVTNASIKKNFRNELLKQRDTIALEKMATKLYEILKLLDDMLEASRKNEKPDYNTFKKLLNEIFSYGSEKAISLVSSMQKELYSYNGNTKNMNQYRVMSYYVLLATQIKYDVTGIYVNPESWFRMKVTDFEESKEKVIEASNNLVTELKLNKRFMMKIPK